MPDTLPTLDGSERELRDGDVVVVQLEDGTILKAKNDGNGYVACVGEHYMRWDLAGEPNRYVSPYTPPPIVLILGPAEETHGDGTVTKLCTLPVTLAKRVWESHDPRSIVTASCCTMNDRIYAFFNLTPKVKPAPSPTYEEKLEADIKAKRCQLPINATRMWDVCGTWRFNDTTNPAVEIDWNANVAWGLGWPPKREPHDPTSIDLAPVRARLEAARG